MAEREEMVFNRVISDQAHLYEVMACVGFVNQTPFRGYPAGTVLLVVVNIRPLSKPSRSHPDSQEWQAEIIMEHDPAGYPAHSPRIRFVGAVFQGVPGEVFQGIGFPGD